MQVYILLKDKIDGTVNASSFGGVPTTFVDQKKKKKKKWDSLVPCIHFLDKPSFACFKSNSLSKNECKILINLILFDPPKLGTPLKLEALTVVD